MSVPLDRHAKRLLDMIAAGRRDQAPELSADSLRHSMKRLAEVADARQVPIGRVEERQAPGAAGPIPVRIYSPNDSRDDVLPGIVYFHGGTGIFCDLDTHDGLCRLLANAACCRVISVGYRLAPEHPFPAGVEDAVCATRWAARCADELQIDAARLVVAGDSAGGTLAAVVTQLAHGNDPPIALQLLICPVTDLTTESESRLAFAQGFFIDRSTLQWAKAVYCRHEDPSDLRISPLRAKSFAGLPPAHIHTAEFDPLHDEGEAYAKALESAGVQVRYQCHGGLVHHFYCMAGAIPKARQVLSAIGADVRIALA